MMEAHDPPKRRFLQQPHGIASQKTTSFGKNTGRRKEMWRKHVERRKKKTKTCKEEGGEVRKSRAKEDEWRETKEVASSR
jgi:aconitase A